MLVALLAACNNDIFIDDTRLEETEATIDGDGGKHTFRIKSKGLREIWLDAYPYNGAFEYYNRKGEYISPESPASQVARIRCYAVDFEFNIYLDGNNLTIISTENSLNRDDTTVVIRLEYKDSSQSIYVTITPGKPMEFTGVVYKFNEAENNGYSSSTFATNYNNSTDSELHVKVCPYSSAQSSILLQPNLDWAINMQGEVPLPVYSNNQWTLSEPRLIQLGTVRYYPPGNVDTQLEVPLTIPPQQHVRVTATVTFMKAVIPFIIITRNPVSESEIMSQGKCTITEPVSYEITTQNI